MKTFDLHCHPTLKPMLTLQKHRKSPWDEVDNIANKIFDSQSNLNQLLDGNCNLACVGLMAIEAAFLKGALVQTVAGPVRYIDKRQIRRMARKVKGYCYPDLLEQEIDSVINNAVNKEEPWERVKWINSMDEYEPDDMDTLYLIATLEGGHALYYGRNESSDINIITDKLKEYRKGDPLRLLYLTLTHISPNVFANHAYAIKILGKKPFLPLGNGISDMGHQVIDTCLNARWEGKPILIDIKHLSMVARKQFYAKYSDKPIIASHVAVTGCSWSTKPIAKFRKKKAHPVYKVKYERQRGHINGTRFNPDSINLYDEDIKAILRSGGLIGLILDERVLGYAKEEKKTSKEFISDSEWNEFIAPMPLAEQQHRHMDDDENQLDEEEERQNEEEETLLLVGEGAKRSMAQQRNHLLHLLNNIMHIMIVGQTMDKPVNPGKHIVIGSDFDGLINAIDCCPAAEDFEFLQYNLEEAIELYASDLIPDPAAFVSDVFYNNGVEFLNKHF
ncbi:membrane dipeptidase [Carboxylicivirga mesophila]|uniref:Membrane dipeptidase n=1 Tax=Carboxylicivirga mesophila TaxID=1166478 RepID=A0ABS5K9V1_9BACT|nr:membrane dipeptidase [Carboxylicivirga mesophila]MBS2211750.1 membrane dipeptidase [Carboxylicivirga mesophila]